MVLKLQKTFVQEKHKLKGLMNFIETCNFYGFSKTNQPIFALLQLNWMQHSFFRIYPGMYDSNKFTSFTDCLRQGKVMPDIIVHTYKATYEILTENIKLSNSTKISFFFYLLKHLVIR